MNNERGRWVWPAAAVGGVTLAMVVAMLAQVRVWFSTTGHVALWHPDVWSSECSQQLFDPYSLTHLSHGLIFAGLFGWLGGVAARRAGWAWAGERRWQFVAAIATAALWEGVENSAWVIDRYRSVTMSLEYLGDSVFNALGDLISCAIGFVIAHRLGVLKTCALFAASELFLLWFIRDNLTLNVVMLLWPIEAIKEWQTAGQPAAPAV
ncbi:MAG: DUF2585 family protein [Phycisphaeraceae bacterium]|nr:DUF2585 family protein [Phycisphaeraceae bacterium]